MTRFITNKVFTVTGKLPVYISGMIVDGVISVGDYLHAPRHSPSKLKGKITSIEYANGKHESFTCLGIDCNSSDEQKMWLKMNIRQGETLEISTQ